jgi:phage replication O-like protein O
MANPQKENGHIQIATQIYEAFCKIRISGEARQVLDFIIRKTYGFHKKEDKIALSQFCLGTGLRKPTVCKALNKLKNMKLIIQIDNDDINIYRFNKDFDTWEALPKKITLPKKGMTITQKGKASLPKKGHTIDNTTKDTITKDISEQSSQNNEVNKIMDIFYKINPTLNWGNKTQRQACQDLIKTCGLEETIQMANMACSIQGEKYAPVVTTPYQFKEKLAQIKVYFDKEKSKRREVFET